MRRRLGRGSTQINSVPNSVPSSHSSRVLLSLQIAELFYREHISQKQIAKRLNISAASVSRFLEFARQNNLVQISIVAPVPVELAWRLSKHKRLQSVRRVEIAGRSRSQVGQAGAKIIEEWIASHRPRPNELPTMVIDGGCTLAEMINFLSPRPETELQILPICADPPSYLTSAVELSATFAAKFRGAKLLRVPAFTGPPLDPIHHAVQSAAKNASIIALGVGPWTLGKTALEFVRHLGKDPAKMRKEFKQVQAVCGYCPLDEMGEYVRVPLIEERMPRAISFASIQERARDAQCLSILMANSKEKATAVLRAVDARLCNTLLVDEELAEELLKYA